MDRRWSPWVIAFSMLLVSVAVGGCRSRGARTRALLQRSERALRERAATDLDCSTDIQIRDTGAGGFRVTGCRRAASYVCSPGPAGTVCAREGEIEDGLEQPGARPPGAGRWVEELAAVSNEVQRCSRRPLAVTLDIGRGGVIERLRGNIASAEQADCILAALSDVRVRTIEVPVVVETTFPPPAAPSRPEREQATAAPAAARANSTDNPYVDPPAEAPESLADWVESVTVAERDAVLACVGRELVALRVTVADGAVRWSLQGDLASGPEEECVAAVLDDATPPAGTDGTVVRVVR